MQPQIFITKDYNLPNRTEKSNSDGNISRLVVKNGTFDSTSADEADERLVAHVSGDADSDDDDDVIVVDIELEGWEKRTSGRPEAMDCSLFSSWHEIAAHIFYISTFAILGTVLRLYLGRFFGLDCIRKEQDIDSANDFLTPLSSLICVTSDGKTQRGGALFIDLPANMLGS
jgi:hypothetical protein